MLRKVFPDRWPLTRPVPAPSSQCYHVPAPRDVTASLSACFNQNFCLQQEYKLQTILKILKQYVLGITDF